MRRRAIFRQIAPDSCVLVQGAGPVRGFERFRQTNEFYYLCGVVVPQAYLLLDAQRRIATLFLPPRSSDGETLGVEDAAFFRETAGVDHVEGLDAISHHLADTSVVYTPFSPAEGRQSCRDVLLYAARQVDADPWDTTVPREQQLIATLQARVPGVEIRDLSPLLDELRLIKSPEELEVLRWAGVLCAHATREAIRATRPGKHEYDLEAVADYVYRVNGVMNPGYCAIIAAGENIWHAHYNRNDAVLKDGDIVLLDYAPDVSNYTSDIGRAWPVNGRYSPVQRELYGFIVVYHKALLRRLQPGLLPREILADAAEEMRAVIDATSFSQPAYKEAAERTLVFTGHLSHPVGMAVHDVGRYFDRPLEVGMVFSVDPQMWIPEERLYVRVEDTVAITNDGVEVLTSGVPIELDELETLVGSRFSGEDAA